MQLLHWGFHNKKLTLFLEKYEVAIGPIQLAYLRYYVKTISTFDDIKAYNNVRQLYCLNRYSNMT